MIGNLSLNACPSSIQHIANLLKPHMRYAKVFKSEANIMEDKGHVTYLLFESIFKNLQ